MPDWPDSPRRGFRALKTVPILPSLVTLGNVFFGFLAVAKAADAVWLSAHSDPSLGMGPEVIQKLEAAALLIFVAMVFDALDGTVARLTRQTSSFGAQLDSIADMVTFGVAPAFLAKVLIDFHVPPVANVLQLPPKAIYVAAVIYVLCATLRLARFNVETPGAKSEDHEEFSGLPSPAAAAVVASLTVLFCVLKAPRGEEAQWFSSLLHGMDLEIWLVRALPLLLVALGLLMVSRIPYPHLVVSILRGRHSFPFLATLVVAVGLAALEWQFALFAAIVVYVFSGVLLGAYRLLTRGKASGPPGSGTEEASSSAESAAPPPHLN